MGSQSFGISAEVLEQYAAEVKAAADLGVEIAVVIGGGNIFRGVNGSKGGVVDRATGDYMGMLATVIYTPATGICERPLQNCGQNAHRRRIRSNGYPFRQGCPRIIN